MVSSVPAPLPSMLPPSSTKDVRCTGMPTTLRVRQGMSSSALSVSYLPPQALKREVDGEALRALPDPLATTIGP